MQLLSRTLDNSLKRLPVRRLQRYWLTVAFFLGFVVDNITLNRVDQVFDNVVLASYVVFAAASLYVLYAGAAGKVPEKYQEHIQKWAPLVVQFAFGGLLSGILIFYGRSGTLFASWPFILIILGVIIGNETLKKRAGRLVFNLTIFFIGLFSYIVLVVPVITGKMGALVFVLSGFIALIIAYWFVRLLMRVVPNFITKNIKMVVFSLGMSYFVLNFLYFTNIIPPIPLSLKDIGIYHSVTKLEDGQYQVTYEKGKWYHFFRDSDTTYHYEPGDQVFCFASVFAPTRLSTTIFHRWEFYDEKNEEWRTHDRLSYSIDGGRDGGFRGFTTIQNVRDGTWRCTVETERKQVLGRDTFTIETRFHDGFITEIR